MPNLFGDLTEEELRLQSEQFGNFEYEADQVARGGPTVEAGLDANRVRSIMFNDQGRDSDLNFNLKGYTIPSELREIARQEAAAGNTPVLADDRETVLDASLRKKKEVFDEAGYSLEERTELVKEAIESEEPTIFTIGSDGSGGDVAAHEFRHAAWDILQNTSPDDIDDPVRKKALSYIKNNIPTGYNRKLGMSNEEDWNRKFDVFRGRDGVMLATDARNSIVDEYNNRINQNKGWSAEEMTEFGYKAIDKRLAEVHKDAEKFAKMEAATKVLKWGNKNKPDGRSWQEYYMKLYLQRKTHMIKNARQELDRSLQ